MGAYRYRIEHRLARGRSTEVLEGRMLGEHGFERAVAIKRLVAGVVEDEKDIESFIDEARIASQLHHPGVVAVLDFGVMDDLPFQALELVDGLDLEELLQRRGELSPEVALYLGHQIGRTLDYVHHARGDDGKSLRIVHRDISPKNLLVSWAGDVKVSDFGIARASVRRNLTEAGVAKGTLSYMAPEQLSFDRIDSRADLFALGCVLHRSLVGRSPMEDADERARVVAGSSPKLAPSLPADVLSILTKALKPRPAERFARGNDFAEACWSALARRSDRPPEEHLRSWLEPLKKGEPVSRAGGALAELLRFEVALEQTGESSASPIRRYTSVVESPETELDLQPTTLEPAFERSEPVFDDVTDTAPRAVAPERIREFDLRELLADTPQYRVYRAQHAVLKREYRVKIVRRRGDVVDKRAARRLKREAEILGRLEHPNVADIVDFGNTDDGEPFLVFKMADGILLSDLIAAEAPLDPIRAARLAQGIAAGLDAVHFAGMVHGGLEPRHISVDEDDRPVILDFGSALMVAQDMTQVTRSAEGPSPEYAAPEVIRGGDPGPAADMYSLGIIIFEMLTGRVPFSGPRAEVVHAQLETRPPSLTTGTALAPVVSTLLAKDPADRMDSARKLIFAIDALGLKAGDETEPGLEGTAATQPARQLPERRTRNIATAVLVAVVSLAVGFAWAFTRDTPRPEPRAAPVTVEPPAPVAVSQDPDPVGPKPDAPEVEDPDPIEPPSKPDEVSPTARPTKRPPRTNRRPNAGSKAKRQKLERRVAQLLRAHSAQRADVMQDRSTAQHLQALEQALSKEDFDAAEVAIGRLERALETDFAPSADRLAERLKALGDSLRELPVEEQKKLERSYLSLRVALKPGITAAERRALATRIRALERSMKK